MLMSPVIAMLHDVTNNRWHPLLFREAPLPSGAEADRVRRWKSAGHHTAGFDTREEALEFACGEMAKRMREQSGSVALCLDKDFPWDGEGIPATVSYFSVSGDVAELVM